MTALSLRDKQSVVAELADATKVTADFALLSEKCKGSYLLRSKVSFRSPLETDKCILMELLTVMSPEELRAIRVTRHHATAGTAVLGSEDDNEVKPTTRCKKKREGTGVPDNRLDLNQQTGDSIVHSALQRAYQGISRYAKILRDALG